MKRQTRLGAVYDNVALFVVGSALFLIAAPIVLFSNCIGKPKPKNQNGSKDKDLELELAHPKAVQRKPSLSTIKPDNLQLDSRLLRLPGELRNKIYAELFGLTLGILACTEETPASKKHNSWVLCQYHESKPINQNGPKCHDIGALGLLRTCRQIYSEAISLLYSSPIFTFFDYKSFLIFSASIPSEHFHAIRSLRILPSSYVEFCKGKAFPLSASYLTLHQHNIAVYNDVLPRLDPPVLIDAWRHCCQMFLLMQNLKTLEVGVAEAPASDYHRYLGGSPTFWSDLKAFSQAKDIGDGFKVIVDTIPESMPQLKSLPFVHERKK